MHSRALENYYLSLTVQDIIISNPLRSAGVRELEIVTLYAVVYGGSERTIQRYNYIAMYL